MQVSLSWISQPVWKALQARLMYGVALDDEHKQSAHSFRMRKQGYIRLRVGYTGVPRDAERKAEEARGVVMFNRYGDDDNASVVVAAVDTRTSSRRG